MAHAYGRAGNKREKVSPPSRKISFNPDNRIKQNFHFRIKYGKHIFKNASASLLLKLYKTCKFFYNHLHLIIIEDFEICGDKKKQRIVGNSMAICLDNPAWNKLDNLWISKSFKYAPASQLSLRFEHKKFSHMTYSTLDIFGQLSLEDYLFLIKPTTVRHLIFQGEIYYPYPVSESLLSIEDMLKCAPHVSAFDIHRMFGNESFPSINMKKLLALERQTKLQLLHLWNVPQIPNPLHIIKFLKKHATPDIDYYFGFQIYDSDDAKTFFTIINAELRAWKTLQLPLTISSSFIDLTGKIAVITACDGIGKATAILFRQLGASVTVFSRNKMELKSLVEECHSIKNDGFLHTVHVADLCPYDFDRFYYKFGSKIDILINYCDIFGHGGVPDIKEQEKFRTEGFVIRNRCDITGLAKPYMIEAKGTMINVTNPYDLIVDPEEAEDIVDNELEIKNNEAELLRAGVRINTVDSGAPVTALPRPPGISDVDYKKFLEKTKKAHEQQIAKAVALLASDSAKLVDGTTFIAAPPTRKRTVHWSSPIAEHRSILGNCKNTNAKL